MPMIESIGIDILSIQNLVTKAPSANLPAMLVAQLLPFVKNLCTRKWSDEDIIEDVQFLRDELNTNFQSLTYVFSVLFINMLTYRVSSIKHIRRIHIRIKLGTSLMESSSRIRRFLERKCS